MTPWVGLSLMLDPDFFQAAQPLFEAGEVEVLEWSFDMGWGHPNFPGWAEELLAFYSDRHRLIGHGVSFSLLSAAWSDRQTTWLRCLQEELDCYHYRHLSEHFGWMSAGHFSRSAPFPLLLTTETLEMGRDRLHRLAEQVQVPLGLENLAFAFGWQDVEEQGQFLEQLLAPIDGFLVLDLHNLYCQMHNFGQSAAELLHRYPLHRVRELHISGGSWSRSSRSTEQPEQPQIRRDTHDQAVPTEVFELLAIALQRIPTVEAVIFERMGGTLGDPVEIDQFRSDFAQMQKIVRDATRKPAFSFRNGLWEKRQEGWAIASLPTGNLNLEDLARFQALLLDTLDSTSALKDNNPIDLFQTQIACASLNRYIDGFENRMIEVAVELVKKWSVKT